MRTSEKGDIVLQTELMVRKTRSRGGGLVDLAREENFVTMIQAMPDVGLHVHASKGTRTQARLLTWLGDHIPIYAEPPSTSGKRWT